MPHEEVEIVDYISKIIDTDNWMLNLKLLSMLDDLWGPHTIACLLMQIIPKRHACTFGVGDLRQDAFMVGNNA